MRRLLWGLGLLAVLAACAGEDGATTTTTPGAITTLPGVTTSASPTTSAPLPTTSAPETATTAAVTTTGVSGADPGMVVVAGRDGVVGVAPDGTVTPLVEGAATVAVDDTMGGLLFQTSSGPRDAATGSPIPPEESGLTTVWWVWADSADPRELLVPDPGNWLTLEDAARIDDALTVFYQRRSGQGPEDLVETLRRYDVAADVVTEVAVVGAWESGSDVSIGGELVARSWFAEAQCGLDFFDLAGDPVDVAGAPAVDVSEECRGAWHGELSPDDRRLAYTEPRRDVDGLFIGEDVVIVDAAGGEEVARIPVREEQVPWLVGDIDLAGDVLVVNRVDADDRAAHLSALVFDVAAPEAPPRELPIAGRAALMRSPIVIDRPVTVP